MEGILDIMQALFSTQARLWFRPALPDQDIKIDRKAKLSAKSFGEQSRLVEASLSQSFHMKGDGEDHLHKGRCFSPKQLDQQFSKRRRPMELASKLQLMNPFANHTRMLRCGTRTVKQEDGLQAVAAQMIGRGRAFGKRTPASRAEGRFDPGEFIQAAIAPKTLAAVEPALLASGALSRKKELAQRLPQPVHTISKTLGPHPPSLHLSLFTQHQPLTHPLHYGLCELRAPHFLGPIHLARQIVRHNLLSNRPFEAAANEFGCFRPAQMFEHHHSGKD